MTDSSFEKFNYPLRPAKNIERKMLCEAFGRLSRIAALPTYRYIGFGALGFHDFCLIHQRLGITDMVSIEGNEEAQTRITNNRPYSCIEMQWGMSHDVLPKMDLSKRSIVWLDYERPLDGDKMRDIATAATALPSGSVFSVTVPVDPGEMRGEEDIAQKRLLQLQSRVGAKNVPPGVQGKDLAKWGMAKVTRQIIINRIEKILGDRSAPLEEDLKVSFVQLFNFHYADGSKMLTVGGLIVNSSDLSRAGPEHFSDLEFYRAGEDPYLIESPLLTWREIKLLDEKLPASAPDVPEPAWIPEAERKKYGKVYRYFPAYSEVEN